MNAGRSSVSFWIVEDLVNDGVNRPPNRSPCEVARRLQRLDRRYAREPDSCTPLRRPKSCRLFQRDRRAVLTAASVLENLHINLIVDQSD